jgi:S-DNA-T family DNA segregation ATPase FtsK/SpoIIIE
MFIANISKYIFLVLLLISTILAGVSIIDFHDLDPCFNRASDVVPQNVLGYYGAVIADLFLQILGLASYPFLLLVMSHVYKKITRRSYNFLYSFFASVIFILSVSCLLANVKESDEWMFSSYGGVVGYMIKGKLDYIMGFDQIFILSILAIFSFPFAFVISRNQVIHFYEKTLQIIERIFDIVKMILLYIARGFMFVWCKLSNKGLQEEEIIVAKISSKKSKKKLPVIKDEKVHLRSTPGYQFPSIDFLKKPDLKEPQDIVFSTIKKRTEDLKQALFDFGVKGEILSVHPGPVVTLFEFEPESGIKSSRVIGLADDIARVMLAESARISVIPGRNAIGIELPNAKRQIVLLRELFESVEYKDDDLSIPIVLGKNISGKPIIVDLTKMPHLLIAGTTGSGKSVGINTMILSILYKLSPEECKLIMIDPKVLELSSYDGIPHLLSPVVTEPNKAIVALKWVVREMERRYRLMSNINVRNMKGFNERIREAIENGEVLERLIQTGFNPDTGKPEFEKDVIELKELPYIVVIVDEMADLMLVAGKEIETSIQRIAQMARAAGIHVIMATQRPSVDVITGVIKANFPTRISFQVTSRIDSRTILGEQGAEQLLGMGDMLYLSGGGKIVRVHGPFVSDGEVEKIVDHLKTQSTPSYIEDITSEDDDGGAFGNASEDGDSQSDESLYKRAVEIVTRDKKVSTSYVQRRLRIGYNRAALLIERMEEDGIISAPNHSGRREIIN